MTGREAVGRLPDRLPVLGIGRHSEGSEELCVMEAAAWLAGEPWSDHPRSVHPAIADIARWVNDRVDDATRQSLWPLVIASLDTAAAGGRLAGIRMQWAAARLWRRARDTGRLVEAWEGILGRWRRLNAGSVPPASYPAISARFRTGGVGSTAPGGSSRQ